GKTPVKAASKPSPAAKAKTSEPPHAEEAPDIDALLAAANEKDPDAQEALNVLAVAAGASEMDVANAESWEAVVAMIQGGGGGDGGVAEAAATEEFLPEVEQIYKYQMLNPKTGQPIFGKDKKPMKPVEVEVMAVDPKTKTVTLKSIDDGRTMYKNVPFDSLESA
ncbi:MAG: hypothetical protein Q7T05_07055, partial [Dehalococcoidia bacterium]|nr:hypothetical protein [Dehalococcoidia bacterium]